MLPLEGIKIVDLTRLLPGPFCSMILGDLGADVIKIEPPPPGDYMRKFEPVMKKNSALFYAVNRNKKSICLDLKKEEDYKRLIEIVKEADIFLEGNRPDTTKKLKIDYENISKANPSIIYCSISGFGQESPYKNFPGHDINYIALGGILDQIRDKNKTPVLPNIQIADLTSSLWAAIAVLAALKLREHTGRGCYIDLSMLDAVVSTWLPLLVAEYTATKVIPTPDTSLLGGKYPCYRIYRTKDGKYLALGALEEKFWETFCNIIDRKDLIPYQFSTDEKIITVIEQIFASKDLEEWLNIARKELNLPLTPVRNIEEVISDPHFKGRNTIWKIEHPVEGELLLLGLPFKMSNVTFTCRKLPPDLDEDGKEIIRK